MSKKNFDIQSYSRALVVVAIILMFVLGILQVVQGFIDTRDYSENILATIKKQTGKDAVIKGKVTVSLLPTPTIYIPNIELHDKENPGSPVVTIETVAITSSFFSMFADVPSISGISLTRPTLELSRRKNGDMQWDWLNYEMLGRVTGGALGNVSLDIVDGKILYHNALAEEETTAGSLYLFATLSHSPQMKGSFELSGHKFQFSAATGAAQAGGGMSLNADITVNESNRFTIVGTLNLLPDHFQIDGKLEAAIADALSWGRSETVKQSRFDLLITNESIKKNDQATILPVSFSANMKLNNQLASLDNIVLGASDATGSGKMQLSWNKKPAVALQMGFENLDYNKWGVLLTKFLEGRARNKPAGGFSYDEQDNENPIPSGVDVNVDLTSKVVAMGSKNWENVNLSAKLEDAIITVNRFAVDLPGQSNITMFGVVSQSSAKDIRFEGSMEAQGKNLKDVLVTFDESVTDLPEIGLNDFSIRSNMFLSSRQVRLSEADLKIGELHLNGGLVAYNDESPRIEADIKLKDINFDYFRDAWRKQQQKKDQPGQEAFFFKMDKTKNLAWLKKLRTSVDFKIAVDKFTFLERAGDSASFRLFAKDGELGIYNVKFTYPEETMEISFNINVNGEAPLVNVVFNASQLDTQYFMSTPASESAPDLLPTRGILQGDAASEEEKKERWAHTLVDMSWLEGMSGIFDISVGSLKHRNFVLDEFKMRAKLEKNVMNFQALSFNYWKGKLEILGSVYGGNVPGIALSFTFYNGELLELLQGLVARDNISGKISVSGSLATSGVNVLSWLTQAESKIAFNARGVKVQGFNLQGVLDAVAISRTAPDVFNNVNRALVDGSTQMDVQGNINLKNAVLKTPGIRLKIDDNLGNLTGEVKLLPWKLDLSTFFQFPNLTSETVPTMSVQLNGPINAPEMQSDTSSLEAYVAKRIISK